MAYPQELALAQLVDSKLNPRKTFIEKEIAEIAESAAQLVDGKPRGIVEPLIVRPHKVLTKAAKGGGIETNTYEIVCGAKRFRAAKKASLPTVPVRVVEYTDAQVLETQLIENLQRSDPHPLEEADGYAKLLKMEGYNADVLAEKVGKDRSYIYKRIQLTHLIEPLKGKFLTGAIHIGHALQICRLREPDQILVAKQGLFQGYGNDREAVSISQLADFIERNVYLKLASAPWDREDAGLVPKAGACIACTKRTGANALLFDDAGKDDRCLDRACFQSKQAALIQISIAKAGEKGVDLVKVAKGWQERQKKQTGGVLNPEDYEEAVSGKCPKPESAIIVAGEDLGKRFQICRTRGCKQHGGYRAPARTASDTWRDKERALKREIDEAANQRVALAIMGTVDKLGDHETRAIARQLLDNVGDDELKFLAGAVGLDITEVAKKKRDWRSNPVGDAIRGHIGTCPPKTVARLIVGILALDPMDTTQKRDDFEHVYKVDRKAITKRAGAELLADFRTKKAAALAKAKKPKKPAPPIKAAKSPEAAEFQRLVPSAKNVKFHPGTKAKVASK